MAENRLRVMDDENKRVLRPIEKAPKVKQFGAIDTETEGNDAKYIDGGCTTIDGFRRFDSGSALINYLSQPKFKSHVFFCHNATYDVGVLYPYIESNHTLLFLNGDIYLAKVYPRKSRRFYIADSWRLAANISLERLGNAISLPKLPTPQTLLEKELGISGWSCVKHGRYQCEACYLERDCQIVYNYIDLFQKEINRLGGELKYTLASTAMDLFRRSFLKEEYRTPFESRNEFARKGYYGGRVEPFKKGRIERINIYDVNSLYPYVMRNFKYPNPNTLHGPSENQPISRIMESEGVSEVSIHIPDMRIPPLPFRYNHKLYFPTGRLRAHWTHAELRKSLKMGCTIYAIHWTLWSDDTIQPFNDYVDTLYQLRLEYKASNDPREHIIKIMLNSLYGKFGQRQQAGLEKLVPLDEWWDAEDKSGFDFVEYDGFVYARKPVPTFRQPDYVNLLWASHITGYARLTLLEYMLQFPDQVAYCDTDSVFVNGKLETGNKLGQMKLEYANVDVELIAPKCYQIFDQSGLLKTKVRGVPSRFQEAYLSSHEVSYMKSLGFFEANRRKLTPAHWVEVTKSEQAITPKRHYLGVENTSLEVLQSRAFDAQELLSLEAVPVHSRHLPQK